jgi:HK97 family phage portal protein
MEATRITTEKRSAPSSWDLLKTGADYGIDTAGVTVSPYLAENLSVVFGCVQVIAETVGMLPLCVYRRLDGGDRAEDPGHPVARIFRGDPNERQTATEFIEMMTAHCLLRGNSYAEIVRDNRGAPAQLLPFHPDHVSVVRIPRTGRYAYDVSLPEGSTRRLLPEEMLHLRDRSDDGVVGKSRLARARETFGTAIATERYAGSTFRHGASMSGVLSHPEAIGDEAATRLRKDFEQTYSGADNAGKVAVLEEGLKWQQVSVSPDDAQMLESRKFSTIALARIFRVPPPVIGDFEGGNYSSMTEIGRWFYAHCIMPWLNRWERLIERDLLSTVSRRTFEVEFDTDLLLRGDMLTRFQAYRIARDIGVYNANELRRFEKQNKRTDPEGEVYFAPANMQQEQKGRPIGDRGGGDDAAGSEAA